MLTTGFSSIAPVTSKVFPLFILASSVCKSLQCLISALTQAGRGSYLVRLTCSVVLWGRRNTANKYHWHVWGVLTVNGPHWVCPSSQQRVLSGSTLLRLQGVLQGTVQCALPKSKLLRFRFLGTLQGHRLGWACVLCPSQVGTAQATRCLASTLSQVNHVS